MNASTLKSYVYKLKPTEANGFILLSYHVQDYKELRL